MLSHTVLTTAPVPHAGHTRLPACPQCNDLLLAPLLAEHVNAHHVRNHWVCESCGHSFRKSTTFEALGDTFTA